MTFMLSTTGCREHSNLVSLYPKEVVGTALLRITL